MMSKDQLTTQAASLATIAAINGVESSAYLDELNRWSKDDREVLHILVLAAL